MEARKVDTLKTAYEKLQTDLNGLRAFSLRNFQRLREAENNKDKEKELFYTYQLTQSDEMLETFEKEYIPLLDFISLVLEKEPHSQPSCVIENAVEGATVIFNEWLILMQINEE